jgi:hypothetical protein
MFHKERLGLNVRPDHVSAPARPAKIDRTGQARKTGPWQAERIVKKYFSETK